MTIIPINLLRNRSKACIKLDLYWSRGQVVTQVVYVSFTAPPVVSRRAAVGRFLQDGV